MCNKTFTRSDTLRLHCSTKGHRTRFLKLQSQNKSDCSDSSSPVMGQETSAKELCTQLVQAESYPSQPSPSFQHKIESSGLSSTASYSNCSFTLSPVTGQETYLAAKSKDDDGCSTTIPSAMGQQSLPQVPQQHQTGFGAPVLFYGTELSWISYDQPSRNSQIYMLDQDMFWGFDDCGENPYQFLIDHVSL